MTDMPPIINVHTDTLAVLPIPASLPEVGHVVSAVRLRDDKISCPGYIVIARREEYAFQPFSTNVVFTRDGGLTWIADEGHYDLTFAEATEDLLERAARGI